MIGPRPPTISPNRVNERQQVIDNWVLVGRIVHGNISFNYSGYHIQLLIQKNHWAANPPVIMKVPNATYNLFASNLMSAEERSAEHKKTLAFLNKALAKTTPMQPEPFPKLQRSRRVCSTLEMTPQNLIGETWDPVHLDKLLKVANSSDNIHSNSSVREHQILGLEVPQNKNTCLYGYSNIFPLVRPERSNSSFLAEHKSEHTEAKRPLDREDYNPLNARPLGHKQTLQKLQSLKQEIDEYQEMKANKTKQIRLKHILANQYRHGLVGFENPQSTDKEFSDNLVQQPTLCAQKRTAAQQNYQKYVKSYIFNAVEEKHSFPRETYELSPVMMRKGRAYSLQQIDQGKKESSKKTFNKYQDRNFDIISNRKLY